MWQMKMIGMKEDVASAATVKLYDHNDNNNNNDK